MNERFPHFGLSDAEWQLSVTQLRDAILRAARERRMTHYSEIAAQVSTFVLEPFSPQMNYLLAEVALIDKENADPLLTSIVTHKTGDLEPGQGFYGWAKDIGFRFNDPLTFWAQQVQAVFTRYGDRH